MGFISDLTGQTGARMAGQARADAQARETINQGVLAGQYPQVFANLTDARNAWDPMVARGERYGTADPVLMSSLGIGDPNIARSAFRAGPGYDFMVQQGLEAAQRGMNATRGATGNQWAELARLGTGYANQEYSNWQNRLAGAAQMGGQYAGAGAAGRAAGATGIANAHRGYAQDAIGVTNLAGQQVQGAMGQEAQARGAGAANMLNAGIGLASLALGAGGGMPGLGGLTKMIPGMGGPQTSPTALAPAYANNYGVGNPGGTGGWF